MLWAPMPPTFQGFGTIGGDSIQEIEPHIQRLTPQGNGFGLGFASPQPQTTVPAAAEASHTHAQPRFAQCDLVHHTVL